MAGLCALALAGIGFAYRPIRNIEAELPDNDPGKIIIADKDRLQEAADRQLEQYATSAARR